MSVRLSRTPETINDLTIMGEFAATFQPETEVQNSNITKGLIRQCFFFFTLSPEIPLLMLRL